MFVSGGQTLQLTLFDTGAPAADLGFASCERRALDESSWVEVAPGWMSGADELLAELLDTVRWRQRRVRMYDRMVAEPRLTAWWGQSDEPTIAIVVLGERRSFRLRPIAAGPAPVTLTAGHGDLLVMGGACQHRWQHCVPKTRRPVGPRVSLTFRHVHDDNYDRPPG